MLKRKELTPISFIRLERGAPASPKILSICVAFSPGSPEMQSEACVEIWLRNTGRRAAAPANFAHKTSPENEVARFARLDRDFSVFYVCSQ